MGRKALLGGGLVDRIAGGRAQIARGNPALEAFLESEIATETGPFRFAGRAPLREIARHLDAVLRLGLPERTVSVLKGTQVGMTTFAIGLALYCCAVRRLHVGYFLPDQDFADRFDDTRVRPAIRRPRLAAAMRQGRYRGAARKGLKEFPGPGGSRFLYILGLRDIGNAISIPLDVLIRDEVDDLPPENLRWSNDRLDASKLALTVNLAMGRTPGGGIHAMYLAGDQRKWRIPCGGCGREIIPEEHWPDVLAQGEAGFALACPRCGAALSSEAGRWAPAVSPKGGAARMRSYRLSQLAVAAIRPGRVAAKWAAAGAPREQARFRCSTLALPDAGAMQSIDREMLQRLRGEAPHFMEEVDMKGPPA